MMGMLAYQKLLACLEIRNNKVRLRVSERESTVWAQQGSGKEGTEHSCILKGSLGAQGTQINVMKLSL